MRVKPLCNLYWLKNGNDFFGLQHCFKIQFFLAKRINVYYLKLVEHMEVHHHPEVEKKGLKEYLLEGFMIFLAVSMGFIAENIRENITEHKTEKILAESVLEDMKKDTASLNSLIVANNKRLNSINALLVMLHLPKEQWNDTNCYRNMAPIMTSVPFNPTDGTYTQMKTSGTLRYFKQSLVNLMNEYDVQTRKTAYRDNVVQNAIWVLGDLIFDSINLEVLADMRFNKPIIHEMYLNLKDKAKIDKFINLIVMNQTHRIRASQEYEEQLKIATKLINNLQAAYHFKNE